MLPSPLAATLPTAPAPPAFGGTDLWQGGSTGEKHAGDEDAGQSPVTGPDAVAAGECLVTPLALGPTCASEARNVFREVAGVLGLPDDLVYDGITMASELAANTLHAHDNVEFEGLARWPVAGGPELWMYLRRVDEAWEMVCKVFDSMTGWRGGRAPRLGVAEPDALGGRGLQVVAALSSGRWGYHLTRSRLGGWRVPGKTVWFALRVAAADIPGLLLPVRLTGAHVARTLEARLAARELGSRILRVDEQGAGMSVLSIRHGLTLWCHGGAIWWRTRHGDYERQFACNLEEVAERVVCLSEEMDQPVYDRGG